MDRHDLAWVLGILVGILLLSACHNTRINETDKRLDRIEQTLEALEAEEDQELTVRERMERDILLTWWLTGEHREVAK